MKEILLMALLLMPVKVLDGNYPVIQQHDNTYWLVFTGEDGLYITNSSDLINWSKPVKIPGTREKDYHPWFLIDDKGYFRVVFVRHRLINPEALKEGFDYDIYATYSKDGSNWVEPYPVAATDRIEWYPHLYQDGSGNYWLTYSMGFPDGNNGIYVRKSSNFVKWSEPYEVIPPNGSYLFGKLFEFKGKWWLNYAKFTGNYDDIRMINNHDIFIAYGDSPYRMEAYAQLSFSPPLNFTLYNDAKAANGRIWIAYTSTIEGNEEVYLISSQDGINWSKPLKLSRNVEYIARLKEPYNFKCDQKSLIIDKEGRAVVVYQSAIFKNNTTIWVAVADKVPEETFSVKYVPVSFPEVRIESKKSPAGLLPVIVSLPIALRLRKLKLKK